MKMGSCLTVAAIFACGFAGNSQAEAIAVTAENYAQAETAWNFENWAKLGADKDIFHYREVSPVGKDAPTVRMNWDTLYSARIVKVSDDGTFSITLPETDLYISAQVIDENGFSPYFIVDQGVETEVKVGTDYAWVLFRTGVPDRNSQNLLDKVHGVQDQIQISGMMADSTYTMPAYDQEQLDTLRTAYKQEFLEAGIDFTYAKGPGETDQHILDLSHAAGWGGYPPELGVSNAYSSSAALSGEDCLSVDFEDPLNKFFTSFTLYDADGYLMEGNSYLSSYDWKADADGRISLRFNCGGKGPNDLTSHGQDFSYTIRNYGVSQFVLDGGFRPVTPNRQLLEPVDQSQREK